MSYVSTGLGFTALKKMHSSVVRSKMPVVRPAFIAVKPRSVAVLAPIYLPPKPVVLPFKPTVLPPKPVVLPFKPTVSIATETTLSKSSLTTSSLAVPSLATSSLSRPTLALPVVQNRLPSAILGPPGLTRVVPELARTAATLPPSVILGAESQPASDGSAASSGSGSGGSSSSHGGGGKTGIKSGEVSPEMASYTSTKLPSWKEEALEKKSNAPILLGAAALAAFLFL